MAHHKRDVTTCVAQRPAGPESKSGCSCWATAGVKGHWMWYTHTHARTHTHFKELDIVELHFTLFFIHSFLYILPLPLSPFPLPSLPVPYPSLSLPSAAQCTSSFLLQACRRPPHQLSLPRYSRRDSSHHVNSTHSWL